MTAVASTAKAKIPHYGVIGAEPLSETLIPKLKSATAQECIEDLRRIATINAEIPISRNFYRVHGKYAESVWNQFFGTFEEFKRQAGLKLTRQQHALERNIAQHASVDHYRALDQSRQSYSAKYERPSSGRFKTLVVCSDLHDIEIDPFYLRVLIDTVRRVQPDNMVFGGDVFDLPEFGKYGVDPREWDVVGRMKFAHQEIFRPIRQAAPEAQFDLIEGNHECVEENTEVLCESGWVDAKNIDGETKVASYTLDGKSVRYDTPVALKRIENQALVSVTGDFQNELVSETHRVDVLGALVPVVDLIGSSLSQVNMRQSITVESAGIALSDDQIRLLTWTIMDGTILSRQRKNRRIQFKFSKPRKIERLKSLLDRMGFKYTFREATKSSLNVLQPFYICLYGEEARWVWDALDGLKAIPQSWKQLNAPQLHCVLEELEHTDAYRHFNKLSWRSTCQKDIDVLQIACILNGVAFAYGQSGKSGFINGKPQFVAKIADRGLFKGRKINIEKTGNTGSVIAIQTVNGTLITRRNGKVNFTGNCRLLKHMADATPALRAVLSDLHGLTLQKLFGLDEFECNYIAKADLAAWTKRDQGKELAQSYKVYYDSFLVHHFPHARNMGLPGVNGHHHAHIVWSEFNPVYGAYEWHQLGAHKRSASYCEGEKWHLGFAIVNIDTYTRAVNFDYVPVTDFAVSGGQWYYRSPNEQVATSRVLLN